MGAIFVEGIEVWAHHGVLPEEQALGQKFLIDVRVDVDTTPAAMSDDLADAVDYSELAKRVVRAASGEPVHLLETLADRVLDACMEDERVREAAVAVRKPRAPMPVPVGEVRIERRRRRG